MDTRYIRAALDEDKIQPWQIISYSNEELATLLKVSVSAIETVRTELKLEHSGVSPVHELSGKISTGVNQIDYILNGGIQKGQITEIFGPGGSGKTCFCCQVAINQNAVYITTEHPVELIQRRIKEISSHTNADISRIRIYRANDATSLRIILLKLRSQLKPDCIIIDSIPFLYDYQMKTTSLANPDQFIEKWQDLNLKKLAYDLDTAVVVVNHVVAIRVLEPKNVFDYAEQRTYLEGGKMYGIDRYRPALDTDWSLYIDTRLKLVNDDGRRTLSTIYSKHSPPNSIVLEMSERGLNIIDT